MTTEASAQAQESAPAIQLETQSLDAAAFAAATAPTPAAPTPGTDAGKEGAHAVDAAVKAADAAAGEGEAGKTAEELSFRDMRRMSQDDISKLLAEEGAGDLLKPQSLDAASAAAGNENLDDKQPPASEQKQTPTVPKPRLDTEIAKRREKEEEASAAQTKIKELEEQLAREREEKAYLKGVADARASQPATGGKEGTQPQNHLAEIDADLNKLASDKEAAILSIAKDFDDGKIGMAEAEKRKLTVNRNAQKLENVILAKREQVVAEMSVPDTQSVQDALKGDTRLVQATNKLMNDNPWFQAIPDTALPILRGLAEQEMAKKGIPNVPTPESTWALRSHIVSAARALGYDRLRTDGQLPPAAPGAGQQPTPDQRKAKLDLAGSQPPAPGLGGTGAGSDQSGNVNYETMPVKDLAKLLPSDRLRQMLEQ